MSTDKAQVDNVTPIRDFEEKEMDNLAEEVMKESRKDFGKVALIISMLSVLLLVVFFFGLNQNITGIANEVETLVPLKGEVATLNTQVGGIQTEMGTMNEKIAMLEKLPEKMQRMVISDALQDMEIKLNAISSQMQEGEQAEQLKQARDLILSIQSKLQQ